MRGPSREPVRGERAGWCEGPSREPVLSEGPPSRSAPGAPAPDPMCQPCVDAATGLLPSLPRTGGPLHPPHRHRLRNRLRPQRRAPTPLRHTAKRQKSKEPAKQRKHKLFFSGPFSVVFWCFFVVLRSFPGDPLIFDFVFYFLFFDGSLRGPRPCGSRFLVVCYLGGKRWSSA